VLTNATQRVKRIHVDNVKRGHLAIAIGNASMDGGIQSRVVV
jgi:hypothetical protein